MPSSKTELIPNLDSDSDSDSDSMPELEAGSMIGSDVEEDIEISSKKYLEVLYSYDNEVPELLSF